MVREGTVIYDTTIASLRRFNEDAREVATGFECGIVLANFQDLREGDILETYETRLQERELSSLPAQRRAGQPSTVSGRVSPLDGRFLMQAMDGHRSPGELEG